MILYLGVGKFQSSCLLDCHCLKPNPYTDNLTSKPPSHNNWPREQRWERWQAYFSFSHVPSLFARTTECKLRMDAFKGRSSKSVRHYLHFFSPRFSGLTLQKCVKAREPLETDQERSVMQPRQGCGGRISPCLRVWPFGPCTNAFCFTQNNPIQPLRLNFCRTFFHWLLLLWYYGFIFTFAASYWSNAFPSLL